MDGSSMSHVVFERSMSVFILTCEYNLNLVSDVGILKLSQVVSLRFSPCHQTLLHILEIPLSPYRPKIIGTRVCQPRGGRLQYEMPGCVCWGSENVPIMKEALCQKTYPYRRETQHT